MESLRQSVLWIYTTSWLLFEEEAVLAGHGVAQEEEVEEGELVGAEEVGRVVAATSSIAAEFALEAAIKSLTVKE